MHTNRSLYFIIALAVTLSLLTTSFAVVSPAMASSKGGGSVLQEKVSSGNSGLDKKINSFYSCISKTHQDPPTREKVDNCYYQTVSGGGSNNGGSASDTTAGGTSSPSTTGSTNNHHHKH
jgi:hypothetical protein